MLKILTKLSRLSIWTNLTKINILLNFLYKLLNVFTCFLIVYLVVLFSKYHTVVLDDIFEIFFDKNKSVFYQMFINVYHGRYIGNFLTKLTGSILPAWLSIHPNVWIQSGGAVIKGIFLAVFSFSLAKYMFIFNKKNLLFPLLAFFCYLYYQFNFLGRYEDNLYTSFYGYTFPFIFLFIFWQLFIKYIFKIKDYKIGYLYLFAFLTGISTEFTSIVTFFALLIILIFYKKVFDQSVRPVIISAFSLIFGMFLYFTNAGFVFSAQNKGVLFSIKDTLLFAKSVYIEFIKGYIHVFYSDFIFYFAAILILMLIIIFTSCKENKQKFFFLITAFTLSAFMFYFLLIFSGDTHSSLYSLYVYHFDLIMQMKFYFLMIILFELGILSKNLIVYTICIISIIFFNLYMNASNTVKELFYINKYLKHGNIRIYTQERRGRFYKYIYGERYFIERIYAFFCYKDIPVTILKDSSYNSPAAYISYPEVYMKNVYKNYPKIENETNNKNELYKIYLESGGVEISDSEIQKADFQSLLNKNFVLYGKKQPFSI